MRSDDIVLLAIGIQLLWQLDTSIQPHELHLAGYPMLETTEVSDQGGDAAKAWRINEKLARVRKASTP